MNNRCFKTIFSERLGAVVAVGEHACAQSKSPGGSQSQGSATAGTGRFVGSVAMAFAWVSLSWAQPVGVTGAVMPRTPILAAPAANALPQGGQVTQGSASLNQAGNALNITQNTSKAVINWQSFDIGTDAKVNVLQPNSQSVLLNRVLSDNPTQIFGQLNANGQVVLVNPKGIVVGSDGSVSASAFTASTLNITDADFMAGNARYTRDSSTGEVINKGRIEVAPGGYVALLGASVSNEGKIIAPQGGVALGAAETITVPIGRTGKIKLELTPSSINTAVANQKDGVIVAEGGQVYMQAAALGQAVASVLNSGSIDTSGVQAGAVHLLADGGHIKVDGHITANSSGQDDQGQLRKGGDIVIGRDEDTGVLAAATNVSGAQLESNKGFVETSGDWLATYGTRVLAKDWLLDPTNITIAASGASGTAYSSNYTAGADSVILASDISASLTAGTSVTLATSATGTSAGDINVNASISKTAGVDATLTLKAHNDINAVFNGLIAGDNLTVSASGQFDTRHAGTGKTVTLSNQFGGTSLANYTIAPQASVNANITPAALTVTADAARKTYDGNTSASGTGVVGPLSGAVAGDRIANSGSLVFTDKNAGTGKTVTVSGVTLRDGSGVDVSADYAIQYINSNQGVIERASASITAQPVSMVYDSMNHTQSGAVLSGFVAGDSILATGLASGRNVGNYNSNLSATGADAGNYVISYNNAPLTITPRPASLGTLGQSVVYNGAMQTLQGTQGSGFIDGDALVFTGLPSGRNVGQYTSALSVSGADAANYLVSYGNATLTITPKTARIGAPDRVVTYNGTTQTQTATVEGLVTGDDIQIAGLANGRNAGRYTSNLSATGTDLANYSLHFDNGSLTIGKASLNFIGTRAENKVSDGLTQASVTPGTIQGLMGSETLNIASVTGQFDTPVAGENKAVTVVYDLRDGQNGGLISNYEWSPVVVKANITTPSNERMPRDALAIPLASGTYSRIGYQGFGGAGSAGAAVGRVAASQETSTCSALNLEDCICTPSVDEQLEICYPADARATKPEAGVISQWTPARP